LVPVRQFDHGWGYTRRLAGCLVDRRREPDHSHEQMVRQRLYGILRASNVTRPTRASW